MASVDEALEAPLDDPEERVEGTEVLDVSDRRHRSPASCASSCSTVCEIGRGDDRRGERRVVRAVDEGLWVGDEATAGDQRPEPGDP